ncbi:retrovirus-related pol polyprotein from transposon TNT 1-94 [Tanacetum coccineum]
MVTPGNYVQWKSRIKRYIDTKPNSELFLSSKIHHTRSTECEAEDRSLSFHREMIRYPTPQFGKFTSRDGESLESYYSRFYKMMNELVRNQCHVTNHQVNVQFLLQLQPEWQRFVTLVKQSQELKTVSYHKLYDILKQHQNEVNEIRTERLARTANPLALKIYKPTNNNLQTSSNTSRANQDNSPRITEDWNWKHIICTWHKLQEVTPDPVTITGPIFNDEPMHKTNQLMFKDLKKFQAELDKYKDVNYASKVEIDCAKAKGDLIFLKKAQRANPRLYDIGVIPNTSANRPQLKSNHLEDRVMSNNSQGKKQEVEDHLCTEITIHDLCVLHYINGVNSRTRQPMAMPISTREPKQNVNQSVATSTHVTIGFKRDKEQTEFLNKTLHAYFAKEGIRHETSTARTPEQNGVVERRNRTLVEAARTMLSAAKVPLFFWAEAIFNNRFTQNRSLVIPRHEKTPYHIINAWKPSVKFFHIFGSLCYIVRDGENLDKMKEKGDACIFVGYSTQSKAYRVFNKRTRMIVETIHVNFDELPQMASDHVSSDPGPQCSTTVLEQDSLSPDPQSQENVPQVAETVTTSNELELLYSPMFSELLNGNSPVVSKSSAVHAADNPDKRQQHNTTHTQLLTTTYVCRSTTH